MVLHHVAHGAGIVIKTGAAADADRFGHRNLYALDVGRLPQGTENGIAETQHHQVLYCFFAQVMVDPVDLVFGEMLADSGIDGLRRGQIMTQRLLQHHARLLVDQAGG